MLTPIGINAESINTNSALTLVAIHFFKKEYLLSIFHIIVCKAFNIRFNLLLNYLFIIIFIQIIVTLKYPKI